MSDSEELAQDIKPSLHQAAGHGSCLTMEDGSLFVKPTTSSEVDFYTETQSIDTEGLEDLENAPNDENDEQYLPGSKLTDWMPICMGVLTQGDISKNLESKDTPIVTDADKEYIVLQNLYHGFSKPSILDIKLGSKLVDEETTSPEKIERLQKVTDSTTSGSLHFRICGMKLHNGTSEEKPTKEIFENMNNTITVVKHEQEQDDEDESDEEESAPVPAEESTFLSFDKFFGRTLSKDNVDQAIYQYFTNYLSQPKLFPKNPKVKTLIAVRLLEVFLTRLQLLYNCLTNYEVRIFSGSLLFIFESDFEQWGLENDQDDLEEDNLLLNDDVYELFDPLIRDPLFADDDMDIDDFGEEENEDGNEEHAETNEIEVKDDKEINIEKGEESKGSAQQDKSEEQDKVSSPKADNQTEDIAESDVVEAGDDAEQEDDDSEIDSDIDMEGLEDIEGPAPLSSLNFIDFAHAKHVKGQGPDDNILTGIQNLIEIFERLLETEKKKL